MAMGLVALLGMAIASRDRELLGGVFLMVIVFSPILYFSWRAVVGTEPLWSYFSDIERGSVLYFAVVLAAAWVVLIGAYGAGYMLIVQPFGPGKGGRSAVITVFTCAVVGALILTLISQPPLPTVRISTGKEIEGVLLTHTDRFWYVFEERAGQPGSRLTAIPDAEVKTARISSSTE
jgi:hypothetical protein